MYGSDIPSVTLTHERFVLGRFLGRRGLTPIELEGVVVTLPFGLECPMNRRHPPVYLSTFFTENTQCTGQSLPSVSQVGEILATLEICYLIETDGYRLVPVIDRFVECELVLSIVFVTLKRLEE